MTTRRGPVDPRLMQLGRGVRAHMALTVVLGGVTALLVIAQAWLLADVIARAFDGTITVADVRAPLTVLLVVVVARAATAWYTEVSANRAVESREVAAAGRARREARRRTAAARGPSRKAT